MADMTALEKAKMIAAKITGQFIDPSPGGKRPLDSNDDPSSKKFAVSINDAVGAQLAMLKAQQLGGNMVEEYKVPDKLVGLVIGRGGEQLHRLQADTQCKVQIAPDANGAPDRNFTLVGSKDAIERAKRSIDEILKRGSSLGSDPSNPGASTVLQRNNIEIVELKLPGNKCGLIIGKGGETIKRLSEQFGVKLVVVQETNTASGSEKPLRITGEPEKVAAAKSAILEMLNPVENYQDRRQGGGERRGEYGDRKPHYGGGPNQQEAFIKVPGDKAGIVIGKGGESIKDINRRSGAHVEIDRSQRGATDGTDKMFIIRGDQEQIQYAQQLIYEKITGVQGSQPPQGYFNDPSQGSPMHSSYSGQGRGGHPGYGGQQQQHQQYMGYQQAQAGQQQGQPADVQAAWAVYYQQYYGVPAQQAASAQATTVQSSATGASTTAAAQPAVNPVTGQADYSQQWVEYYRSMGLHEQADAILKQIAVASGSSQGNGSTPTQPAKASQQTNEQKQQTNGYGGVTPNGVQGQVQGGYVGNSGGYGGQQGYQSNGSGSYNREHRGGGH